MDKFTKMHFIHGRGHTFAQLLAENELFKDKIKDLKIASDFNDLTKKGERKDMSAELFKIWARWILKKVIKKEYFMMASINLTEMENTLGPGPNYES